MSHTPPQQELASAEWGTFFQEQMTSAPLMVILRGVEPDQAVTTARAAWDAGVALVEVTVERPEGLEALAAVVHDAGPQRWVGAGTLTTPGRVIAAHAAGAKFGVAPGLDHETVIAAAQHQMPFLPGASSATEVTQAINWGFTAVKAFPASQLGPDWIPAMRGPFPQLQVVATGGINASNARDYLASGALGLGVGGAISTAGGLADLVQQVAPS